jgi:hypothetical protein
MRVVGTVSLQHKPPIVLVALDLFDVDIMCFFHGLFAVQIIEGEDRKVMVPCIWDSLSSGDQ